MGRRFLPAIELDVRTFTRLTGLGRIDPPKMEPPSHHLQRIAIDYCRLTNNWRRIWREVEHCWSS
ncbi:MAG: hypothetical protein PSX37_05065 [bacterium]|nr:hypothetical protein [bacterium]